MEENKSPLVSVIMPAYNAASFIGDAIQSIINQTYQNWELLIADDGSSDNTKAVIDRFKSDPRIRPYHNEANMGSLKTRNKLFDLSKGSFIAFQDADDTSEPTRLEKQLKEFEKNSNLGVCGSWAVYKTLQGEMVKEDRFVTTDKEIRERISTANQFCCASVMVPTKVIKEMGGLKEYFAKMISYDYDLCYRITDKYDAANIPEFLYLVQAVPNSFSRTIKYPEQFISEKLVKFLAQQRKEKGADSLTGLDFNELENYRMELLKPFLQDSSLIYRKAADTAAWNKNKFGVVQYSWKAFREQPAKLINVKYLVSSFLRYFLPS